MTIANFDDIDLYYQVYGDGPPLIFAHGASGSHLHFWQQVPAFRDRFTCVVYDQRGFGASRPKGTYDPADGKARNRDLCRLIEHLGMDKSRVCLIGSSLGTWPVMDYAAAHPDRVAAVVVTGGYGQLRSPVLDRTIEPRATMLVDYANSVLSGKAVQSANNYARSSGEIPLFGAVLSDIGALGARMVAEQPALSCLHAQLTMAARGPSIHDLVKSLISGRDITAGETAQMTMPVLAMGGEHDQLFKPEQVKHAASMFPNGEYAMIENCGHSPYFEAAEKFNGIVKSFFSRHGLY